MIFLECARKKLPNPSDLNHPTSQLIENSSGFVTIALVIALPFIMALTFSGLWTLWFINQKRTMTNLCHSHVLKSQDELISGNRAIVNMNWQASLLMCARRNVSMTIYINYNFPFC